MKILITGATGLLGKEIGRLLKEQGHSIVVLSRNSQKARTSCPFAVEFIEGDLGLGPLRLPESIEAVVHLAGENVSAARWTSEFKKRIRDSRILFTKNLVQSLPAGTKVLVAASAIGIYSDSGEPQDETQSLLGESFLAQVCKDWEQATSSFTQNQPDRRLVTLRLGVVLHPREGAIKKMRLPFSLGVGGVIGDGSQNMSWIHYQDAARLFVDSITTAREGVFNAVAPEVVSNREFSKQFAGLFGHGLGPPVPVFALKLLFGEMATVIAASQNIKSIRLADFKFLHPDLRSALGEIKKSL